MSATIQLIKRVLFGNPVVLQNIGEEKLEKDKNPQHDIIGYKGTIYEVPTPEIYRLANLPENLSARIERTVEKGMGVMDSNGGYGCHYCDHYANNLAAMFSSNPHSMSVNNTQGDPGTGVRGCSYQGNDDIKWATQVVNTKTGIIVMARRTPCIVHDSMIEVLAERGLLDKYMVDKVFFYPTLDQLPADQELQRRFEVTSPV